MIGLPKPTPAKKRRAGGHIFIVVCVIVLAIAFASCKTLRLFKKASPPLKIVAQSFNVPQA
jgi:hypothetical protein